MIDTQTLLQNLRMHWALQQKHCRLLQAQERALLACNREQFCALQPEHDLLVGQLQKQEEALRGLLRDGAGNTVSLSTLLAEMPESVRRPLQAVQAGLLRTLEQARALAKRTGPLIQNELDYLAFSLDLFVEAGRAADAGYGGRGPAGGRLLLDRRA